MLHDIEHVVVDHVPMWPSQRLWDNIETWGLNLLKEGVKNLSHARQ